MSKIKYILILIVALTFFLLLIPEKYQEIETRNLLSDTGPIANIYNAPNNSKPFCAQNSDFSIAPLTIDLSYSKTFSFDKISIYFPGNAENITSFAPINFRLEYKSGDTSWKPLDNIPKNTNPYYEEVFTETKHADSIQILTHKAFSTNTGVVCFSGLRFYKLQKTNPLERVSAFITNNHCKIPFYFIYYLIFLSFLFIPGYTLLTLLKTKGLENDFQVIVSPIVSIGIMMVLTILYLISGVKLLLDMYLLIFFVSLIIFLKDRLYLKIALSKEVFYTIAVSILIVFGVIAKRDYAFNLQYLGTYFDSMKPIPMNGYIGYFVDNFFPWGIARLYLNRSPMGSGEAQNFLLGTTLFERTPGLPLILTPILKIFGESHQVYQRFIETLVGIFFGTIYVLAKKLFSKKTAIVATILVLLNAQLLYMDFNAELFYKYIATYPSLIALMLFYSKIKNKDFLIGLLLGLSFLIHPSTLMVAVAFGFSYLLKYKITKKLFRKILPVTLILGILFSTWVLAPRIIKLDTFNSRKTSLYFKEALNIDKNLIGAKVSNLLALFYPNPHLKKGDSTFRFLSKNHRFQILRYSIIFNITPIFFGSLIYFVVKNFKKDYILISFFTFPLISYWLIYLNRFNQYYNYGGAYFLLYPFVVPVALIYLTDKILKIKDKLVRRGILASYVIFMVINLCLTSNVFRKDLISPNPVPHMLTLVIVLTYLGLSFELFLKQKSND